MVHIYSHKVQAWILRQAGSLLVFVLLCIGQIQEITNEY